jgi:SAM-dependent methyltransferase
MAEIADQIPFWNQAATSKQFAHPLDLARLKRALPPSAAILDFGCGQGRLIHELNENGFADVVGVDFSPEMIRVAHEHNPAARLVVADSAPLPFATASFDCVLLFAVLTCIASDDAQRTLIREFKRLLRPGGLLLISDYPLQSDRRNAARYASFEQEFGVRGTFRLPGGGVVRHHGREWFAELLADFRVEESLDFEARTMNGNPALITQIWARMPRSSD